MKRLWTSLPTANVRMTRALACGVGAVLLAAATLPPTGDVSVVSLSVEPTSGRAQVVIGVSGAVRVRDFVLHEPERIVVDISDARLGIRGGGYDRLTRGGVLDVRYAQNQPNVVRVVLTLAGSRKYEVQREAGEIRILVDGGGEFAAWGVGSWRPTSTTAIAARPANAPASNSQTSASAASAPAASAPAQVTVRSSVEQVMTPQAAPVPAAPSRRNIAAPTRGEYSPGAPFRQQQTRPQQPRITIAWENAPINDVLAAFAAFSGRTIIPAKAVGDLTVTAEIIDKPWDVAMRAILNANGLDAVEDQNGIIIVNTIEALAARPALEAMITRTVRLNYTSSSAVAEIIRSRLSRDCTGMQATAGAGARACVRSRSRGA